MEDEKQELNPAQNIENKVLKLSLKYEKGAYSYLYWPCKTNLSKDRLHITAKFLGDVPFSEDEIIAAVEQVKDFNQPINVSEIEWQPIVFATKGDGAVAVLELTKYPDVIAHVHAALQKFRRDDYDIYKPHITVSKEIWEAVAEKELTPQAVGLEISPLELSVRGLVKYKWGDDPGPVEEIDGQDVHTNNPTGESLAVQTMNLVKSFKV